MDKILKDIQSYKDKKYAKFSSVIVPGKADFSLRVPQAKIIAKKYAQTVEGKIFLHALPHASTDEYVVHGLMIGYVKDVNAVMTLLEQFLPNVDNWATCDITCSNLKIVKKYPKLFEKCVKNWLKSDNLFTKRFAIVILLTYFLDDYFDISHFDLVNFYCDDYYVKMAQSWYFSVALVKKYDLVIKLFENKQIKNKWVHNKSIQKACESLRISADKKQYLKKLRCDNCL